MILNKKHLTGNQKQETITEENLNKNSDNEEESRTKAFKKKTIVKHAIPKKFKNRIKQ